MGELHVTMIDREAVCNKKYSAANFSPKAFALIRFSYTQLSAPQFHHGSSLQDRFEEAGQATRGGA